MHVYRHFLDVYVSPWGAVPFRTLCGKLTNRPHGKVEGRAIVRIGRRDSIVHIQVLKARFATIVGIATTIGHTQTRNGSRNGNRVSPETAAKITIILDMEKKS